MTFCHVDSLLGASSLTSPLLTLISVDSLILGQASWVPIWLTPIWLISLGLALGAIGSLAVYLVLALLSYIPGLGTLADSPRRGISVSLVLGGVASALLCYQFIQPTEDYYESKFLPTICVGLLLGFGLVYGMWHRTRSEWAQMLSEGVVPYLLGTAAVFGVIGLAATPVVNDPMAFIKSVAQVNIFDDGVVRLPIAIAGAPDDVPVDESPFQPAGVQYDVVTATSFAVESDRTVLLTDTADSSELTKAPFRVDAGKRFEFRLQEGSAPPIPDDSSSLHIQNRESDPANVVLTFLYLPKIPEVASAVAIALTFFLAVTGLVVFRQAAPRVWALALSTAKNEMAQPLYLLLLAIGLFLILLFGIYPFNTLGDDIRVLKDSGVTMIMVLGMLQAIWSAGTSVTDEIDGRTALTVLSKPVSRRSFILGKYAGIMLAVLVLFVIIGAVLAIVLSYKPIFEARETTRDVTTWQQGHAEIMTTIPLLILYFMETMAIGAVAVALATRLPLLANFISCFVIYVIGNLTSPLVASTEGNNELVGFVGKLIAVVVPNLNNFNVQSAVDVGNPIPMIYLCGVFNYLVCFALAAWMLAMLLFEDRDLA